MSGTLAVTCPPPGCDRGWCPQRDDLGDLARALTPGQVTP